MGIKEPSFLATFTLVTTKNQITETYLRGTPRSLRHYSLNSLKKLHSDLQNCLQGWVSGYQNLLHPQFPKEKKTQLYIAWNNRQSSMPSQVLVSLMPAICSLQICGTFLLPRWAPGTTTTPFFIILIFWFFFLTVFYTVIFSARGVHPPLQNYHSTNLPYGWLGNRDVIKSRFAGL